jgi:hypothetical protein
MLEFFSDFLKVPLKLLTILLILSAENEVSVVLSGRAGAAQKKKVLGDPDSPL